MFTKPVTFPLYQITVGKKQGGKTLTMKEWECSQALAVIRIHEEGALEALSNHILMTQFDLWP
jgi:hypothetical protein